MATYIGTYGSWDGSIFQNVAVTAGTAASWDYTGSGRYDDIYKGYIKVDKGSPDKAKYVIFYAVNKKDPMIFCKTQAEVKKEIKKLMKRKDVDQKSIRFFRFSGGTKLVKKKK